MRNWKHSKALWSSAELRKLIVKELVLSVTAAGASVIEILGDSSDNGPVADGDAASTSSHIA